MSEQDAPEYFNSNSGAAPQPGGFAGVEGLAGGHGSFRPGHVLDDEGSVVEDEPADEPADEPEEVDPEADPGEGSDGDGTPGEGDDEDDVVTDDDLNDDVDESTGDDDDPGAEDDDPNDSGPDPAMTEALAGNKDDALKYASEHPDQKAAIVAAERAGKNRATVLRELGEDA